MMKSSLLWAAWPLLDSILLANAVIEVSGFRIHPLIKNLAKLAAREYHIVLA